MHSDLFHVQAFNPASGLPFHYVEMESWPKMLRLSEGFLVLLGRAVFECFWSTDTSEGVSVLLDRCALCRCCNPCWVALHAWAAMLGATPVTLCFAEDTALVRECFRSCALAAAPVGPALAWAACMRALFIDACPGDCLGLCHFTILL